MAPQRDWLDKDFYKALGVSSAATDKDITREYRKLAKKFHPDANPGSEEKFKEISAAYEVLGDPAKRKEYDDLRRLGPRAFGPMSGGPGGNFRVEDIGDISDLLGGIFGGGGGGLGGMRRNRGSGARRGADLEAGLHLSFEDAVHGVTTTVNISGEGRCETCRGTGAAPGTTPQTCARCGGKGALADNQGMFSLSRICTDCGGRGTKIEKPCPSCRGSGTSTRARQVKVRIPSGVEDGQRIRVRGRGAPGQGAAPAGDLFVTVHCGPHPIFGRKGPNLLLNLPVTYPEAVLGTTVKVPTLTDPVTLKIGPGTASGRTLRVRGRGIPAHGRTAAGDLLVTVEVVVPTDIDEQQKMAIEHLARVTPGSVRARLETGT